MTVLQILTHSHELFEQANLHNPTSDVSPADYHIAQQDTEMAVWCSYVTYLFESPVLIKVKRHVQATETYRKSTNS